MCLNMSFSWHALTLAKVNLHVTDLILNITEHIARNEHEQFGVILESEDSSEINRYVVENGGEVFHKLLKRCLLHNRGL